MSKKKFIVKNRRKRKIYFSLLFVSILIIGIGYSFFITSLGIGGNIQIYKYDQTLYGVLEKAAREGVYAKEYTGAHQDSMDVSKSTKKIYHWYGSNDADGNAILNKNNVIFGGYCWQMIRTTDTGGVRMIYNGVPTVTGSGDNTSYDCSFVRPGFPSFTKVEVVISGNKSYAADYTVNLSGDTVAYSLVNPVTFSISSSGPTTDTNIARIISDYPYTCGNTDCTILYKIIERTDTFKANAYIFVTDSIGYSLFNSSGRSISDVGYMYNVRYPVGSYGISTSTTFTGGYNSTSGIASSTLSGSTLTNYEKYYFADNYTLSGDSHVLLNPVKGSTINDFPYGLVGKYTCSLSTSCDRLYYIGDVIDNGAGEAPTLYRLEIDPGKEYNDISYMYLFGDSIIDNGNGIFEIQGNVKEIAKRDWFTEYSTKTNKYVCMPGYYSYDSINDKYICSDNGVQNVGALRYVTNASITNFTTSKIYKYGFGITADGANYRLIGNNNDNDNATLQYIYNWPNSLNSNCFVNQGDSMSQCGYKTYKKSHYTCLNLSGVCNSYYFIFKTESGYLYASTITDGKYVSTDLSDPNNILYEILYADDVNTTSSTIKTAIDSWYQINLSTYDQYMDDTIYCGNRNLLNVGGWNPDGGEAGYARFQSDYLFGNLKDLSCPSIRDQYSVSNVNAPLAYKVGLMSFPEINLLNQNSARVASDTYWLITPGKYADSSSMLDSVSKGGGIYNRFAQESVLVRPSISLVAGIKYSRGNGSTTNPYVADAEPSSLSLSQSQLSFRGPGSSSALTYTTDLEGSAVWESSDVSVATVNNGVVTSVGYGTATITVQIGIVKATATVFVKTPFEYDSWDTIANNVEAGTISEYHVGDTKMVELGNNMKSHLIRIANMSTPIECETTGFSQTACGFVLEFTDIISSHRMNPYDSTITAPGNGNVGGWPVSEMRTYLNDKNDSTSIFNSLPNDLRNNIIDTTVVTGYGYSSTGDTNTTVVDKLFLLSPREVWGNNNNAYQNLDSAFNSTRQLDYYLNLNVTSSSNYSFSSKKKDGDYGIQWWLRTPYYGGPAQFLFINANGSRTLSWDTNASAVAHGVSPAFRLG